VPLERVKCVRQAECVCKWVSSSVAYVQVTGQVRICDTSDTPQHQQKPAQSSLPVSALTQPGSECVRWHGRRWWRYDDVIVTRLNHILQSLNIAVCWLFEFMHDAQLVTNVLLLLLLHLFNSLFSRTTRVSRYHKGKTSLDSNEARDDGALGCSGVCNSLYLKCNVWCILQFQKQ